MEDKMKILGLYDISEVQVKDQALKPFINIQERLLIKSHGRNIKKFAKKNTSIIERLTNRLSVSGHVGRKHKIITSNASGKYMKVMNIMIKALKLIEERTKKNPIQVLVSAIENSGPRDEITVIEHGGARYPQAVDCSPSRRIDLAIRWIIQGAHTKSFGKNKKIHQTLANELIFAADGNMESYALSKKNEAEKQADSAR
jgi:small subunit ribosomal protein S7